MEGVSGCGERERERERKKEKEGERQKDNSRRRITPLVRSTGMKSAHVGLGAPY